MTRATELTPLLKRLQLGPMAATLPERIALARREQLDYASFLEIILSDEVNRRAHRRIEMRLQGTGFEETCHLEDFDWSAAITLNRRLLDAVFSLEFLDKHEHVLLPGPAGVGKSFLAQALGFTAIRAGYTVRFIHADNFFRAMAQARVDNYTKRLLAAYRKDGAAALAHGNRGRRRPHNAVPEAAAAAVVKLASNGYAGANHTHLTELLRKREGIDLSRPTHPGEGRIGSPRSRRSPQHRFRRRRMPQEGILVQIDGSHHPWLEDPGPKLTLLIAVDDATSTVAQAVFRTSEDTRGYLVLLEGLIRQWGIPLALYSDRHAAFKYNARQKPVPVETTQFARVMRELGIQQIFALSPQAKGRVERMLETFQDRLVTELRLAGASTIDQAKEVLQEFLPKFSTRFAVAAEHPETAYRPVPDELSLTVTICIKDTRKVARDKTVKYHWRVLQLLPGAERPSYAGLRVDVLERADGELMIRCQGEAMDYQEGPPPSSALWAAASACSPGPEQQEGAYGVVNSHLNEAQRERLAALESSNDDEANDEDVATMGRGGKAKPVRHQLRRTPTETQQARWEAVQQAGEQGLSLRDIARKLGMARDTVGKYAKAESPPSKKLSARERTKAKALALAASQTATD